MEHPSNTVHANVNLHQTQVTRVSSKKIKRKSRLSDLSSAEKSRKKFKNSQGSQNEGLVSPGRTVQVLAQSQLSGSPETQRKHAQKVGLQILQDSKIQNQSSRNKWPASLIQNSNSYYAASDLGSTARELAVTSNKIKIQKKSNSGKATKRSNLHLSRDSKELSQGTRIDSSEIKNFSIPVIQQPQYSQTVTNLSKNGQQMIHGMYSGANTVTNKVEVQKGFEQHKGNSSTRNTTNQSSLIQTSSAQLLNNQNNKFSSLMQKQLNQKQYSNQGALINAVGSQSLIQTSKDKAKSGASSQIRGTQQPQQKIKTNKKLQRLVHDEIKQQVPLTAVPSGQLLVQQHKSGSTSVQPPETHLSASAQLSTTSASLHKNGGKLPNSSVGANGRIAAAALSKQSIKGSRQLGSSFFYNQTGQNHLNQSSGSIASSSTQNAGKKLSDQKRLVLNDPGSSSNSFLLPANLIKANGPNTLSTLTNLNNSGNSNELKTVGNSSFEQIQLGNYEPKPSVKRNNIQQGLVPEIVQSQNGLKVRKVQNGSGLKHGTKLLTPQRNNSKPKMIVTNAKKVPKQQNYIFVQNGDGTQTKVANIAQVKVNQNNSGGVSPQQIKPNQKNWVQGNLQKEKGQQNMRITASDAVQIMNITNQSRPQDSSKDKLVIDKKTYDELMNYLVKIEAKRVISKDQQIQSAYGNQKLFANQQTSVLGQPGLIQQQKMIGKQTARPGLVGAIQNVKKIQNRPQAVIKAAQNSQRPAGAQTTFNYSQKNVPVSSLNSGTIGLINRPVTQIQSNNQTNQYGGSGTSSSANISNQMQSKGKKSTSQNKLTSSKSIKSRNLIRNGPATGLTTNLTSLTHQTSLEQQLNQNSTTASSLKRNNLFNDLGASAANNPSYQSFIQNPAHPKKNLLTSNPQSDLKIVQSSILKKNTMLNSKDKKSLVKKRPKDLSVKTQQSIESKQQMMSKERVHSARNSTKNKANDSAQSKSVTTKRTAEKSSSKMNSYRDKEQKRNSEKKAKFLQNVLSPTNVQPPQTVGASVKTSKQFKKKTMSKESGVATGSGCSIPSAGIGSTGAIGTSAKIMDEIVDDSECDGPRLSVFMEQVQLQKSAADLAMREKMREEVMSQDDDTKNFNTFGEQISEQMTEQTKRPEAVPTGPSQRWVLTDQKQSKINSISSLQSPSLTEESKQKVKETPVKPVDNHEKTQEFHYSGSFGIPDPVDRSLSPGLGKPKQDKTKLRKDDLSFQLVNMSFQQDKQKKATMKGPHNTLAVDQIIQMATGGSDQKINEDILESPLNTREALPKTEANQEQVEEELKHKLYNDSEYRKQLLLKVLPNFEELDKHFHNHSIQEEQKTNEIVINKEEVTVSPSARNLIDTINKSLRLTANCSNNTGTLNASPYTDKSTVQQKPRKRDLSNASDGDMVLCDSDPDEVATVVENECDNEYKYMMETNNSESTFTQQSIANTNSVQQKLKSPSQREYGNESVQIIDTGFNSKEGGVFSVLQSQSDIYSPSGKQGIVSGQVSLRQSQHEQTVEEKVQRKQDLPKFGYEKVAMHADSLLQEQSFQSLAETEPEQEQQMQQPVEQEEDYESDQFGFVQNLDQQYKDALQQRKIMKQITHRQRQRSC